MDLPRLTKRQWLILAIGVSFYCLGYATARQTCWLVHPVSYETKDNGAKVYFHQIDRGDLGPSLTLSRLNNGNDFYAAASTHGQYFIYWIFSPLQWIESVTWHLIPRKYVWR